MEPKFIEEVDDRFDNEVSIQHLMSEQTFEVLIQFSSSSALFFCGNSPATLNQDYQLRDRNNETSFTLLVLPGSTTSTVPFTLLPDNATETNESFLITLSHPENSESPNFLLSSFGSEACVLIEDDDSKYI